MATNAEILDIAMSRLGKRSSTRVRTDVVSEINSTIARLEQGDFRPWFLEQTATLSLVSGDTFKALPSTFLIEAQESRPYYVEEGTVYYLEKRFYGTLLGEVPTSLKYYAIRGSNIHFRMAADKAYTLYVDYYAKSNDALVDNASAATNVWLLNAQDWVLNEACARVAGLHLGSDPLAAKLTAAAAKDKRDIFVFHEARINENQDFYVGGATDGS